MAVPLSLLDLAHIGEDGSARATFEASVDLAQRAEQLGFRRVWYAEHHNMPSIASSATSVLIAHVAAHTTTIRLGAGGVMLPNHAPLVIAEHYGTLATLHPGRIDLGLGRAPGSDRRTMFALRRDPASADRFVDDVLELQGYLGERSLVEGVDAIPGKGTNVPLVILGSSLYGAHLAAALGLPYAFASHFAPAALEEAVATYRREFRPSDAVGAPRVFAGINVLVADTADEARQRFQEARRRRARRLFAGGRELSPAQTDELLDSPAGRQVDQMLTYTAVGTGAEVAAQLDRFVALADADELVVVLGDPDRRTNPRSLELLAEHHDPAGGMPPGSGEQCT